MLVEKKILSDHFEEIYVSWFSRMKYFALEYVVSEEDAENIVQDVFTELWERKEILAYDVNLLPCFLLRSKTVVSTFYVTALL